MRHPKSGFVKASEQETGVAVAKIELLPRCLAQPGQHGFRNTVCTVAAARPPQRLEAGVVRNVNERIGARGIFAREMPPRQKALRVKEEFNGTTAKVARNVLNPLSQ